MDYWESIGFCSIWLKNGWIIFKIVSYLHYCKVSGRWTASSYSVSTKILFSRLKKPRKFVLLLTILLIFDFRRCSSRSYRSVSFAIWTISTWWANRSWHSAWCSEFHIAYSISCIRVDNQINLFITSKCQSHFCHVNLHELWLFSNCLFTLFMFILDNGWNSLRHGFTGTIGSDDKGSTTRQT